VTKFERRRRKGILFITTPERQTRKKKMHIKGRVVTE
jgi:hypothetical protein